MDARIDVANDADDHHASDNNHNTTTNTKTTKETMILMLMMATITTMINMPSVASEDARQRRSGLGSPRASQEIPCYEVVIHTRAK